MLEGLGHAAIGASSAKRALEILRQDNSIELVITDQIMPQMSGLQLADAIKAEWPELPVILASGFAEAPSRPHELARLPKPFSQMDLAEKVRAVHPMPGNARVLKYFAGRARKPKPRCLVCAKKNDLPPCPRSAFTPDSRSSWRTNDRSH